MKSGETGAAGAGAFSPRAFPRANLAMNGAAVLVASFRSTNGRTGAATVFSSLDLGTNLLLDTSRGQGAINTAFGAFAPF